MCAAWLALTPILLWAMPGRTDATILELAVAGSVEASAEILSKWSPSDRTAFAFVLGFDLLYDVIHNNAVALLVARVAAGCRGSLVRVGSWIAWGLWLATAANVVENLGFFHMIQAGPNSPWPEVLFVTTVYRNGILGVGVAFWSLMGPLASLARRMRAHAA
jgi:hypothetical protein